MRRSSTLLPILLVLVAIASACGDGSPDPRPSPAASTASPSPRPTATPRRASPEAHSGVLAVVNGTLIDGTGAEPVEDAYVVVRDGRIVEVRTGEPEIPADARVVDARGGTILPGLVDAHVHLTAALFGGTDVLVSWLDGGVTTVVDLASPPGSSSGLVTLAAGAERSPRVVLAGPELTAPGGWPLTDPVFQLVGLAVHDPEDARLKTNQVLDGGADIIKIGIEVGYGEDLGDPGWPIMSLETIRAITETAAKRNTVVAAHVSDAGEAQLAMEAGVAILAHVPIEPMSEELLQQMLERDMLIVGTLCVHPGGSLNLKRYADMGGRVALGTDNSSCASFEPGTPIDELERMLAAGLTPMQIIVAATKHGAEAANLGDELGTIEPGKIADLIIVAGDPLEDIRALGTTTTVIQAGEVVWGQR